MADRRFAGSTDDLAGTPTSPGLRAPALAALLQLVPIRPGSRLRVLELDTDAQRGASAIELADWCGGPVVSLSPSPGTVHQARTANRNESRVQFRRQPLASGWPPAAPYELVLAWPLMSVVPDAWVRQCAAGGRLLCPVFLHEPGGLAVLRLTLDQAGRPRETIVATPRHGAPADAIRWTFRPACLEPIGDSHLVRTIRPEPATQPPIDRRFPHGRHRHAD